MQYIITTDEPLIVIRSDESHRGRTSKIQYSISFRGDKFNIKQLPDHGDLIDRDQIKWGYDPHFDTMHIMIDRLYEQPVVIPKSGS